MRVLNVHGINFTVEGDGFVKYHAEDDFERGVEAIEDALRAMSESELRDFAFDLGEWKKGLAGRPRHADLIEAIGHEVATEGWARPDEVRIMIGVEV